MHDKSRLFKSTLKALPLAMASILVAQTSQAQSTSSEPVQVSASGNSLSTSVHGDNTAVAVGIENIGDAQIYSIEPSLIAGNQGYLVTAKVGDDLRSIFATGTFNQTGYGLAVTLGYTEGDFASEDFTNAPSTLANKEVTIGQVFFGGAFSGHLGVLAKNAPDSVLHDMTLGVYGTYADTDSQTVDRYTTQQRTQVNGVLGTQFTTYENRIVGVGKSSVGVDVAYRIDGRNIIALDVGYVDDEDTGVRYGVDYSHLSPSGTLKTDLRYATEFQDDHRSYDLRVGVSKRFTAAWQAGAYVGYRRFDDRWGMHDDDPYVGVSLQYHFDGTARQFSEYHLPNYVMPLAHVQGAEQASTTLYAKRQTRLVDERFVADALPVNALLSLSAQVRDTSSDRIRLIVNAQDADGIEQIIISNSTDGTVYQTIDVDAVTYEQTIDITGLTPDTDYPLTVQAISRNPATTGNEQRQTTLTARTQAIVPSNTAPSIIRVDGSTQVNTGQAVNLTVVASDAQNDTISYRAEGLPTGLTLNNNVITGTLANAGSYEFKLYASDGKLESPATTVALTVSQPTPQNTAPTAIALSNNQLAENLPAGTVVGVLSCVDPDSANTCTYISAGGDGKFAIVDGKIVTTQQLDFESSQSYTLYVTATDPKGAVYSEQITITVMDEQAPSVGAVNITKPTYDSVIISVANPTADAYRLVIPSLNIDDTNATGTGTFSVVTIPAGTYT